ncbi:MAG: ABC transporter substrate-binding protein [Deltaproteobacteria bacterium]|nr:ABC transporter substrate-binding protein [Deltaproteobacteria bacterium]
MKKITFILAMVALMSLTFGSSQSLASSTIKIGCAYGMTGRIGWIGEDCVNGAKLAVDEINKKGGINGKKVELVIYDTKNNPDTARTIFQKLIKKDKVVAICGPVITQATQTVMPIAEKYKVPYAVVSGGIQINAKILPEYKQKGKKSYTWAMSIGTPRQNEVKTLWLKKKGYKRLGNIEPLSQMGDLSAAMYERWAKKYGLKIVAKEKFDNKGTDFTTQMSKIKAAGADCIGTMASGGPAVTLIKNRDQVGLSNAPMMVSDANLSKKFIKLLGENTANVYTVGAKISFAQYLKNSDPQKAIIASFQNRFKSKFGKGPKSWFFAAVGYDSALMFIKASQAVGVNGEKMRDWLEKQSSFQGVQAVYSWSDLDHRGIGVDQCAVLGIKAGNWVPFE